MAIAEQPGYHDEHFQDTSGTSVDTRDSPSKREVEKQVHGDNSLREQKLDSHGLPLVPQPSRFKDDPLVSSLCVSIG